MDNHSTLLSRQDFLGEATTDLDTIVVRNNKSMTIPLQNVKTKRNPTVTVEATMLSKITLQLAGHGLKNKDFFGKSDPFFVIHRKGLYGRLQVVYKSETVINNLNPQWAPLTMTDEQFCGGDVNTPIEIQVFDWDRGNDNDLIGKSHTTLSNMIRIAGNGDGGGHLYLDRKGGKLIIKQLTIT